MFKNKLVMALVGVSLALGLAWCGDDTEEEGGADASTSSQGGKDASQQQGGEDASQQGGKDASQGGKDASQQGGEDASQQGGEDASQQGGEDASQQGGECDTIQKLRTEVACQGKTVTVTGAVVMGFRFTSNNTKVSMYVQDPAGGPNSGVQVFLNASQYASPTVKDIVTATGTLLVYNMELEIDATKAGGSITKTGTATALPAPIDAPATELGPESTTHDTHLGQRIHVPGLSNVADKQPIEMANWDKTDAGYVVKYNGVKIQGGAFVNNVFTYSGAACPIEAANSFNELTGVWEYYRQNTEPGIDAGPKRFIKVLKPLSCEEQGNQ